MVSYPKYRLEISKILVKSNIYSIDSKRNSLKDETSLFNDIEFPRVLDRFSDNEYERILEKTWEDNDIDPDIIMLIKYFKENKMKFR